MTHLPRPFARVLKRFSKPLLVFFTLLLAPWIGLATQLRPAKAAEQGLPEDHPFQRLWTISSTEFPASTENPATPVHVVWGVETMDRDGVNLLIDPKNKGTLIWDDSFVFDEAAQTHIHNVCREVELLRAPRLSEFLSLKATAAWGSTSSEDSSEVPVGDVQCPLLDWKAWLEDASATSKGRGFPAPLHDVPELMGNFLASPTKTAWGGDTTFGKKWRSHLGVDGTRNNEVRLVAISVASHLQRRSSHPPTRLRTHHDHFERWMREINGERLQAPKTANKAFQTIEGDFDGPLWMWMHTQSVFFQSAVTGAVAGLILAFFVILVCTGQVLIALAALLTIGSILLSVVAMMELAGFIFFKVGCDLSMLEGGEG